MDFKAKDLELDLTKPYNPQEVEQNIYNLWLESKYFNPDALPGKRIKKYIVYMPLPNVTGTLHMGHALDNTLQDILIRYFRMQGYKTLWFPGTDHAGIATQYKVEKELQKEGISRFELGREKFIEKVWQWKEKYGNIIVDQLKQLGISADWSRFRFTMDEKYSADVLKAFVHYYQKGLIYRGKKVVNWCPRCGTSLSDLELEYKEENAKLWYIKYPLKTKGKKGEEFIVVATTRPETMLGDVAVGVNPEDKRYKHLIGKTVFLPLVGREIPIIANQKIDKSFGTGALKITPAHDILDFEIAEENKLPLIQVIDERGKMNENALKFKGLKTEEARKLIVEELKNKGYLLKEEDYKHNVSTCYRCGRNIEPIPSWQWFLKMDQLAKYAKKAVLGKQVKIYPKNFQKIYFNWLDNIKDWAISRQIWWGHQLPVWYCDCQIKENNKNNQNFIVALKQPRKKCPVCKKPYKQSLEVLDTWFSSALWPFAGLTLKDKKNYYPGTTLITARDILNLWVARMIFSGIEFMKKPPFQNVFIHGTVLTQDGKRMSKSLGTGVDPMNYIQNFGADATRFGIIWQAVSQDIRWDETTIFAGKKFNNKIWNAARFVKENTKDIDFKIKLHPKPQTKADQVILTELQKVQKFTKNKIEDFELAQALRKLYDFFWHQFCDQYIEASKKQLLDLKLKTNTQLILLYVLFESLKMLHPFLPFITEAIFQLFQDKREKKELLLVQKWQ